MPGLSHWNINSKSIHSHSAQLRARAYIKELMCTRNKDTFRHSHSSSGILDKCSQARRHQGVSRDVGPLPFVSHFLLSQCGFQPTAEVEASKPQVTTNSPISQFHILRLKDQNVFRLSLPPLASFAPLSFLRQSLFKWSRLIFPLLPPKCLRWRPCHSMEGC